MCYQTRCKWRRMVIWGSFRFRRRLVCLDCSVRRTQVWIKRAMALQHADSWLDFFVLLSNFSIVDSACAFRFSFRRNKKKKFLTLKLDSNRDHKVYFYPRQIEERVKISHPISTAVSVIRTHTLNLRCIQSRRRKLPEIGRLNGPSKI